MVDTLLCARNCSQAQRDMYVCILIAFNPENSSHHYSLLAQIDGSQAPNLSHVVLSEEAFWCKQYNCVIVSIVTSDFTVE